MNKFIMLVGLPGSGKSTLAKELSAKENATILSSDEIREELNGDINDQSNHNAVFDEMNKRATELLASGGNVIYDATNINRKRRVHLIRFVIKADVKEVYYLNHHISTIKFRNVGRSRKVNEDVIDRMYKNLHVPTLNEGWNKVIFTHQKNYTDIKDIFEKTITSDIDHDSLFDELSLYMTDFTDIINLSQDSTYHTFSISRHTYHTYKYIKDNYQKKDKLLMLWTALFHDLGKGFCKSFVNFKGEETKYANFIGHEYVSAQLAANRLSSLGYDDQFVKDVVNLVQFHMMPMKASEKKMNEAKKLIGEDLFKKLIILHIADTQAK